MSTYITKRAEELGKKIVDSKTPLQVEVIQRDIDKAKMKDSRCCAFVRACERSLPVEAAFFFRTKAWLEYEDKIVRYDLPESVRKEIVAFDRSKSMEPGTYHLGRIAPSSTMKAKAAYSAKTKGKSHQNGGKQPHRKHFVHKTTNVRDQFDPSYRAAK